MNPIAGGSGDNGSKKQQQQLDVERAMGEGMDTPPAKPDRGGGDLRARVTRLWTGLAKLLQERPAQVLGAVAGVSFFAGILVGRIGRNRG